MFLVFFCVFSLSLSRFWGAGGGPSSFLLPPSSFFLPFPPFFFFVFCFRAPGPPKPRPPGLNRQPGGAHPGKGTHNAVMLNDEDYLELLAIHDPAEDRAAEEAGRFRRERAAFIAAGGGIRYVVLQSDDMAADVAGMRARGVDVSDVLDGSRAQGGQTFRWKWAMLGPENPLPLFFIQHLTPMAERRAHARRGPAPQRRALPRAHLHSRGGPRGLRGALLEGARHG